MGFNGSKWWSCPKCGETTEVEDNVRSCTRCEWSVTIPMKDELEQRYGIEIDDSGEIEHVRGR